MKLSILNEIPSSREMISVFGGYNHNIRIPEGEFFEMKNLTSAEYPSLSPRKKRGMYHHNSEITEPKALLSKDDRLYYVDNDQLYCDGTLIRDEEGNDIYLNLDSNTEKTLVSMGAYIIIAPDMKYINTIEPSDHGLIRRKNSALKDKDVSFTLTDRYGYGLSNDGLNIPASKEAPKEPKTGWYWIDTSLSGKTSLKRYDGERKSWIVETETYTRIMQVHTSLEQKNSGLLRNVAAGDGITFSNITGEAAFLNTDLIVENVDMDGIVVKNPEGSMIVSSTYNQSPEDGLVTIDTKIPKMDYIIECNNRLWGCRYGEDEEGNVVNQIYSSKLGDFKNWNCLQGISTDSYVASVGTDGPFTGAINYLGYPHFFKEGYIHKVYGSMPANFQIQTTACRGVQEGSAKSLTIINEVLYYKSPKAVCAYDGSLPLSISTALGDALYIKAIGGAWGNKYYISMNETTAQAENTANYRLFVYDTAKGMWHKEDDTQAVCFCEHQGNLLYIDYANKNIQLIEAPSWFGELDVESDVIKWSAETGIIGTESPDKKYITRLILRLSMEYGTRIKFFIDYDSLGKWEHIYTAEGTSLKSFSIPVRSQRCDHLRIRIEGVGQARIFSICKVLEEGSDL